MWATHQFPLLEPTTAAAWGLKLKFKGTENDGSNMTLIGPKENTFSREKVIISYGPDETAEVMASPIFYYSGVGGESSKGVHSFTP